MIRKSEISTEYCQLCGQDPVPARRGISLCVSCTKTLLRCLANPDLGIAKVVTADTYALGCEICGEYRHRKILVHPEWGRVCDVDVREAAEIHRI